MSARLQNGGILIDRKKRIEFSFDGKRFSGFLGDTLSAALLANNQTLVARSFKYHRPRGIVSSGPEEPNALVSLGKKNTFEPNLKATTTELFNGMVSKSQNRWPSLNVDFGEISSLFSSVLPAGFYYKTFIHPRIAWKHLFEPFIRLAAGLGKAPREIDVDRYEHFYCHVDILIIGGGVSGLEAAIMAGASGAKTLLLEQNPYFGGRFLIENEDVDRHSGVRKIESLVNKLKKMKNVHLRQRTTGSGVYDHGFVIGYERVADHTPGDGRPRHRLWKIRAKKIVIASGAIERPLIFPNNDVPGVMLASAVRDYIRLYGVSPGDRTVILTNNDSAYKTAIDLNAVGLSVPAILDVRPKVSDEIFEQVSNLGIKVKIGKGVSKVLGRRSIKSVGICSQIGEGTIEEFIECDVLAMSGGWSPVVNLWSNAGGKLHWDEDQGMFIPDTRNPPIGDDGKRNTTSVGSAAGFMSTQDCIQSVKINVPEILLETGFKSRKTQNKSIPISNKPNKLQSTWLIPEGSSRKLKQKSFVDFQNDVKVSDINLSALEGYQSVEHTKRYTTLGMATDQGKLSNVNGLAILANELGLTIPEVGTTTFRPPYSPISLGSIAGEAAGKLFMPTRRTSIDSWSEANGAHWEPVANWRRPYSYLKAGETISQAVTREIINTRNNVGLLDASTLGKILVKGPDAAKFLDLIYTNIISNLKVNRCRYALMCNENGFLFDDGVVVRLSDDEFVCHTTSGGSDRVYSWMEEWLQTEWWNLKVFTLNITEQFSQIVIAGPKSRALLEKVLQTDLSEQVLPFMGVAKARYQGENISLYRISFSGELSYEVAVPANKGLSFWETCFKEGKQLHVEPYGTEALHVMRAEKGFIMIGDETDGTVTPQDLNLGWAVSKKKKDFIGKRAQARKFLTRDDRKQLVGLETQDSQFVLPEGAHAVSGQRNDGRLQMIGHVTSTYYSPTLGRSIAFGLIESGFKRMGQVLNFPLPDGSTAIAKVVSPVFYNPEEKI